MTTNRIKINFDVKNLFVVTIFLSQMTFGTLSWSPMILPSRRDILLSSAASWTTMILGNQYYDTQNEQSKSSSSSSILSEWSGTSLPLLTLQKGQMISSIAINNTTNTDSSAKVIMNNVLPMARYPDPILRRPAKEIDSKWFGTDELYDLAYALQMTARKNGAVGLAAQQCGVDARMVYLDNNNNGRFLLNPHIIQRSSELQMRVWTEHCLVLPPWIDITTLRDATITVQYQTLKGKKQTKIFTGESARALQHEMDHDRGILILDHVPTLQDLPGDWIQDIERDGFDQRQSIAYDRSIYIFIENNKYTTTTTNNNNKWKLVPPANAVEQEHEFDRDQWLKDRRALLKQSKSSTNRQDIMDLSKQRAQLLYNTTYQGASCIPGLPCL